MILHLHNWRCFSSCKFDFPLRSAVIVDSNGSGKTSLLSGLYTLVTSQAWPHTRLAHHLRNGTEYFGISTHIPEWSFTGKVNPSGRITTKLNRPDIFSTCLLDEDYQGYDSHGDTFPAIFTYLPVDNYTLSGSRTQVLSFIDELIAQQHGDSYRKYITALNKIVSSKQKLIKHIFETQTSPDPILTHTLNQKLAEVSHQVWSVRSAFLQNLQSQLPQFSEWIQSPLHTWSIRWEVTTNRGRRDIVRQFMSPQVTVADIDAMFQQECAAGRVLWGAHRDDIQIQSHHLPAQHTLSRGEMRLMILFLKYTAMQQIHDRPVWFFLDDVFNELDTTRERIVWQHILQYTHLYLATSTRPPSFDTPAFSLHEIQKKT